MEIPYSLVFFTLLAGLAVGSACIAAVAAILDAVNGTSRREPVVKAGAILAFPAVVLGLIASTFHLAKPLSFINGLSNIGSAWISREGVVGILFVIAVVLLIGTWVLKDLRPVRTLLAILAGLLGIVLLYVQAMAYATVRPIPAWNTPVTVLLFFASAFALGALGVATLLSTGLISDGEGKKAVREVLQPFAGIGLVAVIVLIFAAFLWYLNLSTATVNDAVARAGALIWGEQAALTWGRIIVGLVLPLVLLFLAWRSRSKTALWLVLSFLLIVVGEFLARQMFFLAAVHI